MKPWNALTIAARADRIGCHDREVSRLLREQELMRRLAAGETLTKSDHREARRIKRERERG